MKRYAFIFLTVCMVFASCTKNDPASETPGTSGNVEEEKLPTGEMVTELQAQVAPFTSSAMTKTSLNTDTFQPEWEAYDEMGFWPAINVFDGTDPNQAMFFVDPQYTRAGYAKFSANGWGLLRNLGYYSYYPYDPSAKYNKVELEYKGQRQYVNGDPTSVCEFDYLHSVRTTIPELGSATFNYSHVGCIAEFVISVADHQAAGNFLGMTLSTATPVMAETAEYNPSQDNVVIQNKQLASSMSMNLGRGNGMELDAEGKLDLFFMMCPVDWSGKTVSMTLNDSNGCEYSGTFTPSLNQASGVHYVYHVEVNESSTHRNLSALETANCYIVPAAGDYKFKAVKGNSDTAVDVKGVKVLWETVNTGSAPVQNSLISGVEYDSVSGFIKFTASSTKGNAVIAAYSNAGCTGNVLWSWHLWCVDTPVDEAYLNNAGCLMDRNLGALERTGDRSEGLFYQWGRKDPFPGTYSFSGTMRTTPAWPDAVTSDASIGTVEYAIAHPTTFITKAADNNFDWIFANNRTSLWYGGADVKTEYDPCPPGYRVIAGSSDNTTTAGRGFWGKAYDTNFAIDGSYYSENGCYLYMQALYGNATYPMSGCINEDGTYAWAGTFAFIWTNYPGGTNFDDNQWHTQYSGNLNYGTWYGHGMHLSVNFNSGRAAGKNVRCMKMNNIDPSSDLDNEGFGVPTPSSW